MPNYGQLKGYKYNLKRVCSHGTRLALIEFGGQQKSKGAGELDIRDKASTK